MQSNTPKQHFFLGDFSTNVDSELAQNYVVSIKGTSPKEGAFDIRGVTTSEFSIGAANQFSTIESDIQKLASMVPGGGMAYSVRDLVATATSAFGGADRTIFVAETLEAWKGPVKPEFQVEIILICMDCTNPDSYKKQSVLYRSRRLMEAVMPSSTSALGIAGVGEARTFVPPLGYTIKDSTTGKLTLGIGTWFSAPSLIARSCSFTYSKEVNRIGEPIFATGAITLAPYKAITYQQYLNYFTPPNNTSASVQATGRPNIPNI